MDIFVEQLIRLLFEMHDKSSPFNSTLYIVLYPQNGDRIVTIDSVTSLHPICIHYSLFWEYRGVITLPMIKSCKELIWEAYLRLCDKGD